MGRCSRTCRHPAVPSNFYCVTAGPFRRELSWGGVGWAGGEVGRGEMSGVRALRAGGLGTAPTGPTAGAVEAARPARDARAQRQRLHLRR